MRGRKNVTATRSSDTAVESTPTSPLREGRETGGGLTSRSIFFTSFPFSYRCSTGSSPRIKSTFNCGSNSLACVCTNFFTSGSELRRQRGHVTILPVFTTPADAPPSPAAPEAACLSVLPALATLCSFSDGAVPPVAGHSTSAALNATASTAATLILFGKCDRLMTPFETFSAIQNFDVFRQLLYTSVS